MSNTSIGRGPAHGSNENHASDPTHTTLGEEASQEDAPSGSESVTGAPEMPAGVPGGQPKPGVRKGPQSYPDGPNVEASPWELDAAKGKLPRDKA